MSDWLYVVGFVVVVLIVVGVVGYKQGWFKELTEGPPQSKYQCNCGEPGCYCAYCVPKSSIIVDPSITKNPQPTIFITPYPTYTETRWDRTFGDFEKCGDNQVVSMYKPGHCIDCVTQDSSVGITTCNNKISMEELVSNCKQKGGTTMGKSLFVPPAK